MIEISNQKMFLGDCLDVMKTIPNNSVDMILCDLPYGITNNKWDNVIPFDLLWADYWRVLKTRGVVVLTAQPPFDKVLGSSQIKYLKYEWIWEKPKATGHLNAKKQPLKAHENILVFYKKQCLYNPQMTQGEQYKARGGKSKKTTYGDFTAKRNGSPEGLRYPRSVLKINHVLKPIHPTQKPVKLFEHLIKTYTNEGDVVLDNCSGSGTTAIACLNTNRKSINIENNHTYYYGAVARLAKVDGL